MTASLQKTKFEHSAGGIVFKKEGGQIFILLCQHSQHHGWGFPKGLIGDKDEFIGQTKEETALREVEEETGAIGKIIKSLAPVTYWYKMAGVKRRKTVYYFLMQFIRGDITKHDWEMENVEWLPGEKVRERLTHDADKKVWEKAKKML